MTINMDNGGIITSRDTPNRSANIIFFVIRHTNIDSKPLM